MKQTIWSIYALRTSVSDKYINKSIHVAWSSKVWNFLQHAQTKTNRIYSVIHIQNLNLEKLTKEEERKGWRRITWIGASRLHWTRVLWNSMCGGSFSGTSGKSHIEKLPPFLFFSVSSRSAIPNCLASVKNKLFSVNRRESEWVDSGFRVFMYERNNIICIPQFYWNNK